MQLFFILSALTLFLSFDTRKSAESRPLLNFFLRRFFRIAPLFYTAVLFYPWYYAHYHPQAQVLPKPGFGSYVSTLTFTNGWSFVWINQLVPGGWSIAVEMTFYLFVPVLYHRLETVDQTLWLAYILLIAGTALSMIIRRVLELAYGGVFNRSIDFFIQTWFFAQATVFLLGILLYFLVRDPLKKPEESCYLRSLLLLLIAGYLFLALSVSGHLALSLGTLGFSVAAFILAWSTALYPHRLIVNRFFSFLGKISFSAYLTHFIALSLSAQALVLVFNDFSAWTWPLRFSSLLITSLLLTTTFSMITFYLIETPGQRLGKQLIMVMERQQRLSISLPEKSRSPQSPACFSIKPAP